MRLTIKSTVQLHGGPEVTVYIGMIPASDPTSHTLAIAKTVVRGMLKASHLDNAVVRHYVGGTLSVTVSVGQDNVVEQMAA
jgi:hypothetical protein